MTIFTLNINSDAVVECKQGRNNLIAKISGQIKCINSPSDTMIIEHTRGCRSTPTSTGDAQLVCSRFVFPAQGVFENPPLFEQVSSRDWRFQNR